MIVRRTDGGVVICTRAQKARPYHVTLFIRK